MEKVLFEVLDQSALRKVHVRIIRMSWRGNGKGGEDGGREGGRELAPGQIHICTCTYI